MHGSHEKYCRKVKFQEEFQGQKRATKLNIECIQTNGKKIEKLDKWLKDNSLKYEEVIFIGNDINDIDCFIYA